MSSRITSDALPEISFDIRLGQKYKQVDFDYEGYSAALAEAGLTHSEISNMKLNFSSESKYRTYNTERDKPSWVLGIYRWIKRQQTVFDHGGNGLLMHGKRTNRTILHEAGHAYDHMRRGSGLLGTIRYIRENSETWEAFAEEFELFAPESPLLTAIPVEQYTETESGDVHCFINSLPHAELVPISDMATAMPHGEPFEIRMSGAQSRDL